VNDDITNATGKFLKIMADEEHGVDRHCKCGRVLLDPWSLACEVCDPSQLPSLLRQQAA
jgi:hypothetical protein